MRKRRGLLILLIGVALAAVSGLMILGTARQAAQASPPAAIQTEPLKKVYVVVAAKDIAENVAVSAEDVAAQEFPADFAPAGAVAAPEYAVGKYTTSRVYKGQILVAPLLADGRRLSQLSAKVPTGKVAMAVTVNDSLNALGALRAGDAVDILLTLDLAKGMPKQDGGPAQGSQSAEVPEQLLSTQVTMQNVEILGVGAPAGDAPATGQQAQRETPQQIARTITFLLDHQDAVTLKFVKDSGGTMDLVVRSPEDKALAKTDAVTLDTMFRQFRFKLPEPIN